MHVSMPEAFGCVELTDGQVNHRYFSLHVRNLEKPVELVKMTGK
jgi:hypothetical protein